MVADSAQFSTMVTELADQSYVGTALTLQLAAGFTVTVATIWLIPLIQAEVGWRWAFALLVPGPVIGVLSMLRLRSSAFQEAAPAGLALFFEILGSAHGAAVIKRCLTSSSRSPPPSWPVLDRLCQVRGLDGLLARQIRDGARQLEHTVKSARR